MIKYDREMRAMTGRDYPTEKEVKLFNAVIKLNGRINSSNLRIIRREGLDNDIYNVYYENNLVFTIRCGSSDAVVWYRSGEWEHVIFSLVGY